MRDNFFVDSNVLVYLLGNDERKKTIALELLAGKPIVSVQVINENMNAAIKKLKISKDKAIQHAEKLLAECTVKALDKKAIVAAFEIFNKYNYSYYDSLIIASALKHHCKILYSEDLQHGQRIFNTLQILNPFL